MTVGSLFIDMRFGNAVRTDETRMARSYIHASIKEEMRFMANPISIAVPHKMTRDAVRARMKDKVGSLASYIPGNAAVNSSWPGEDRMVLDIAAMGQTVQAILDIEDDAVRVTAQLPGMLGMFAGVIEGVIRDKGEKLLLSDDSKENPKA